MRVSTNQNIYSKIQSAGDVKFGEHESIIYPTALHLVFVNCR